MPEGAILIVVPPHLVVAETCATLTAYGVSTVLTVGIMKLHPLGHCPISALYHQAITAAAAVVRTAFKNVLCPPAFLL
jgi:hypothetical protein